MKLLQSGWMICLLGALIYLGCTLLFLNPKAIVPVQAASPKKAHATEEEPAILTGPSWEFHNPEVDQIISELRAEKSALAQKDKELKELAAQLAAEQREIIAATQTVHKLQQEFDRNVTRVRQEETANLKRLAKLYATMSPDGASAVMKHLEDEQLMKILLHMKEVEVAPILELMTKASPEEAKRVAAISERLRLALYRDPGAK
ncbi:MAG: hypothetical protein FJ405_11570 [Verrucomicrobia bacterium]|nr:hypothetical protein [Verrucomicrobiota bacterium]